MLRVIEYFAKSLKVIRNDTLEKTITPYYYFIVTMYLAPFLRYSVLNNSDTMKFGFGVIQGH